MSDDSAVARVAGSSATIAAAPVAAASGFCWMPNASSALHLLPGLVTGATQVILGHPFDTVKTRTQAYREAASANVRVSSTEIARRLWRDAGIAGFYRGALPPLLGHGTKRAFQLVLWERITPLLGDNPFVSGAVTGATGTILACPMHVVKIQAQTTNRGSLHAVRSILATGPATLYRGFVTHLFRDAAFASVYLGTYGHCRRALPEEVGVLRAPLAAGIASTATWIGLQPLDTFKTLAQVGLTPRQILTLIISSSSRPAAAASSSATGAASSVAAAGASSAVPSPDLSDQARHAVWRSWRGVGAALVRAGPVNAVAMLLYEAVRARVNQVAPP